MSSSSSQSDFVGIESLLNTLNAAWAKVNANKHILPRPALAAHQFLVRSLTQWPSGDSQLMTTSVDFIPVVTIEGLPTNRYPEFLPILVAATVACMRLETPSLALALETASFRMLVSLAVASRAGFWAAMNWTPKCSAVLPPNAIVYDKKRRNLWLAAARGETAHDAWLAAMAQPAPAMPDLNEMMSHISVVGPMCGVMGASVLTALGPLYAFTLMAERLVGVLKSRVGEDLATMTRLSAPDVIEVLTQAPLSGASVHAARVWASDPLVAVGAQRRIAVTPSEINEIAKRETALTSGRATPAVLPEFAVETRTRLDDPMLQIADAVIETKMANVPEPTVFNLSRENLEASMAHPSERMQSVPEDRELEASERAEMSREDAKFIQEVARHAMQAAPPVPSMLNGVTGDESVVW